MDLRPDLVDLADDEHDGADESSYEPSWYLFLKQSTQAAAKAEAPTS